MFSFKLGLKNLTRQKRRNVITIMVIAFAFFSYLLMDSLMNGMEEIFRWLILNTGKIEKSCPWKI
jgi:putative ABC transport system permease protein